MKWGIILSKSSKLARKMHRKEAHREKMLEFRDKNMLELRNDCGVIDPVPYLAVKHILQVEGARK